MSEAGPAGGGQGGGVSRQSLNILFFFIFLFVNGVVVFSFLGVYMGNPLQCAAKSKVLLSNLTFAGVIINVLLGIIYLLVRGKAAKG